MRYRLDIEKSYIKWIGFQPDNNHDGRIYFKEGLIGANNGRIISGTCVLDMNSIEVTAQNLDHDNKAKLRDHLKSKDFLDVDLYPEASFIITELKDVDEEVHGDSCNTDETITPTHTIEGTLNIKGVSIPLRFDVDVFYNNQFMQAEFKLTLDRNSWNMDFMGDGSFGDKRILPQVDISGRIKAVAIDAA